MTFNKFEMFVNTMFLYSYFFVCNYMRLKDFSMSSKEFANQINDVSISLKLNPLQTFYSNWGIFCLFSFIQLLSALFAFFGYSIFSYITALILLIEIVIQENPFHRSNYLSIEEYSLKFYVSLGLIFLIFITNLQQNVQSENNYVSSKYENYYTNTDDSTCASSTISYIQSFFGPLTKNGFLDMRYNVNRVNNPGGLYNRKDGSPDKRYYVNRQ